MFKKLSELNAIACCADVLNQTVIDTVFEDGHISGVLVITRAKVKKINKYFAHDKAKLVFQRMVEYKILRGEYNDDSLVIFGEEFDPFVDELIEKHNEEIKHPRRVMIDENMTLIMSWTRSEVMAND